ncbi:HTH domain-containing protein [Reichenbachiella ulvae]|uniref:HTH domain-containing protein n=1 Tax=Reichenbachiella ulvae TaxID=2980104 RepID=UPI00384B7E63
MDYFSYWSRLEYVLELIKKGALTSPYDLTEKFECSERTVRKMINDLRRKGYNIKYSRRISRYVLEQ